MTNIFFTLTSMAIGSFITWLVARKYYMRAAHDLQVETQRIRNLLRISLQAMEDAKMVTLNRDASGEIVGMVHNVGGSVQASSSIIMIESPEHPK